MPNWRRAAEAGDPFAQFSLGLVYDLGLGIAPDAAKACTYYASAGERGVVEAQFNAAVMIDSGRCGPRNSAEAATWYGRAAANGHARAEYNLGMMYAAGDGLPKNQDAAVVWFHLAAARGVSAAQLAARIRAGQTEVGTEDATLRPPVPAAPLNEVPLVAAKTAMAVPFVWTAPAQPSPVRFYLDVRRLGSESPPVVYEGYIEQSAMLVMLPAVPARYSWRVYAVSDRLHRYLASDPVEFEIGGASP